MKSARNEAFRLGFMGSLCVMLGLFGLTTTAWGEDTPQPARSSDGDAAHASFETFANEWLAQLTDDARQERDRNRLTVRVSGTPKGHSYRQIPGEYKIRIKKTNREGTPYVGVLRYVEHRYECSRPPAELCEQVESSEITEIFPYKNGDWHY